MQKKIQISQVDDKVLKKISTDLKCHPILANILINRNYKTSKSAFSFLNPSLKDLKSPDCLKDIDIAVERIYSAILKKEKILVFGDYDLDGISSTVVLLDFFKRTNTEVIYHIPDRKKEGYGLKKLHIQEVAISQQVDLVITVDCGSDSDEAISFAKENNIDIIITDHHEVKNKENPFAFINPKQKDCHSGLEHLAGVGVAFYLVIALRKFLRDKAFWKTNNIREPNLKKYCDIVALGTIADMVPLIAENRILTKIGLDVIRDNKRIGLKKLIEIERIKDEQIDSNRINFSIIPKINAAGRIDHASIAVDLFQTKDEAYALKLAKKLNKINSKRQDIERDTFLKIKKIINNDDNFAKSPISLIVEKNLHIGVIGIVASKLVREFSKPFIIVSLDEEKKMGIASARSFGKFDLYAFLFQLSHFFKSFGGHKMAAGFNIPISNIKSFKDAFKKEMFNNAFAPQEEDIFIDYQINFNEISDNLINEIRRLEPFGLDNKEPLFLSKDIDVVSSTLLKFNHRKMLLKQKDRTQMIDAIHFNVNSEEYLPNYYKEVVFTIYWNSWKGKKSKQIKIY